MDRRSFFATLTAIGAVTVLPKKEIYKHKEMSLEDLTKKMAEVNPKRMILNDIGYDAYLHSKDEMHL